MCPRWQISIFDCNIGKSEGQVKVVNATGAGDAALAALAYGHLRGKSIDQMAQLARAAPIIALSSENTINPAMSEIRLYDTVRELESC